MEATIISFLVQNPATIVPILLVLWFFFITRKNESVTQAIIDDGNQRESDYKELVNKIMDESKTREDKLMNTIDTTISCQTEAIKELTHHIVQLNTSVTTIEERVERLEVQK